MNVVGGFMASKKTAPTRIAPEIVYPFPSLLMFL